MNIIEAQHKLQKCKRIRGKLAQYDYRNCTMTFDRFTSILYYYQDLYNKLRRKEIEEWNKGFIHRWLMASKGCSGMDIMTFNINLGL